MIPLRFLLALQFGAIVLAGLLVGLWKGPLMGALTTCAGLALLHALHISQLSRLLRWLNAIDAQDVPDGRGAWGRVFAGVYRALRQEARKMEDVGRELELFRQAAQALPNGIVMLDTGDQLLWCNDTAGRHLGLDANRDYGLRVTNIVRVPGLAAFLQGAVDDATLEYSSPQEAGRLLSLKVIPFGERRKLLVSFDITQIERADTVRRDFIANVSHELRTPLTVIHGFLEHMNDAPASAEAGIQRHIALMAQQSDRMLKLVDDLLMLSRLEASDHPPQEQIVNLPDLLSAIAEDARALSAGRHTIEIQVAAGAIIHGAPDELRSAFGNLVSNAVRYTPQGGRVKLAWRSDEQGRGLFSVIDTGIGIAPEHIPRLTERFYRVDRGRSRETGGTGLGLAIVKHVLLRHQAILEIESVVGQGSEFRVRFPAWRSVANTAIEPNAHAA